jgi:hypothetical protein
MTATIAQALLEALEAENYPENVKVIVSLNNGVTCRGTVVSPEQWFAENTEEAGESGATGSWPRRMTYPFQGHPRTTTLHLIEVSYLSGGGWLPGSNAVMDTGSIVLMGDRW